MIDRLLVVPGWGGSGPDHWQRRWAQADPRFVVVEQDDWDNPSVGEWVERLDSAVRDSSDPVVLIAHSLGCHTVARWTAAADCSLVRGALLVAPPDIDFSVAHGATTIAPFSPPTSAVLPFPATLAASATDPWATIDWSAQLAQNWGARFVNLGDCGHVNPDSGYGPWPVGLDLVNGICGSP